MRDTQSGAKPVLVVGAGPVGMTMAAELARYGVPVRIIDKAAQRTDTSRALVLWSRTLELLDRGGGAAPFVAAGLKAYAVNIFGGDRVIGRISMEAVDSAYPYALMLPQSETERLLEEQLAALGITVERRVELVSFTSGSSGVDAVLRLPDGHEEAVAADWLIGCDGAHSTVRHGVGAPFAGETMDSDWMLADIHMTGYPFPESEASVYWHRDGVLVIFPISPGRFRVIANLPPTGADHPQDPTLAEVQAIMDQRGPGGLKASSPFWLAGFRINGRKVASYRYGRVFLAGDAAHVHSPAGGQGMNTGMQDAFNLAWKLALVARRRCGDSLLDSYSPERSGVGDEVLKAAGRLTAVATLRNPVGQAIRNLVGHIALGLSPVRHTVADTVTEVAIGYADSPLNGTALKAGPKPGERAAPAGGQAPVGSGNTPLFALYARQNTATADLVQRFNGLLDPQPRPPFQDEGIWLVRPDGYVACSSKDVSVVADYLDCLALTGQYVGD